MASGTSQGQGPPDPPDSPVALAITAIASRASSPFLSSCNKFILNTVATAKNPVATAKIIFFFILINLIISNCHPYYQLTFSFNADLPCSSIGVKELRLFSHVSSKSLSLFYYYYLLSLERESEEEAWASQHRGFLFFFPKYVQLSVISYQSSVILLTDNCSLILFISFIISLVAEDSTLTSLLSIVSAICFALLC
jgi:hypothetical protein